MLPPPSGTPCNVPWAAHHILGIISLIRSAIYPTRSQTPSGQALSPSQRLSATRALVRILSNVSDRNRDMHAGLTGPDRNLYARLIGSRDEGFIISILADLPDTASHFIHNLEVVQNRLEVHGAPASYIAKFNDLIAALKSHQRSQSSPGGAGSKRQGQCQGSSREAKRIR